MNERMVPSLWPLIVFLVLVLSAALPAPDLWA